MWWAGICLKEDIQLSEDNYCGTVEVYVYTVCIGWMITCAGGVCISKNCCGGGLVGDRACADRPRLSCLACG